MIFGGRGTQGFNKLTRPRAIEAAYVLADLVPYEMFTLDLDFEPWIEGLPVPNVLRMPLKVTRERLALEKADYEVPAVKPY